MPAIIKSIIRTLGANHFIGSFSNVTYSPWLTGVTVNEGDIRINTGYKYQATGTGVTGTNSPVHTVGSVSDGAVHWTFVEVLSNSNNFNNDVYLTIGRTDIWDNPNIGDDIPITQANSPLDEYRTIKNIVSAKRVNASNVRLGIKKHIWDATGATVYSAFDPMKSFAEYATPFYVQSGANIYKCLGNGGGGPSIAMPTGTSIHQFVTPGDNYTWKYMATIDPSDAIQFISDNYIPVAYKSTNDGTPQYLTQQAAKSTSISGVTIQSGGSGYTNATVTISAPTGTNPIQATGSAILTSGVVTGADITNPGSGYEAPPTLSITGTGTGALGDVVLANKDGHGANILSELEAKYVMINMRLDGDESGYFPITGANSFREISLLMDPRDVGNNPATALVYLGSSHTDWDGNETSGKSELKAGSGSVLYIDSIEPMIRSAAQIESLTIILKF